MNMYKAGDKLYVETEFNVCPQGVPFSWDKSVKLKVGDQVVYESEFVNFSLPGNPVMLVFTFDGQKYAAVAQYFSKQKPKEKPWTMPIL